MRADFDDCNIEQPAGKSSVDQVVRRRHHTTHEAGLETRKRKRLRQGTHSCWECKRRKERCTRDPADPTLCHGCRRRSTACVSQEVPEQDAFPVNTIELKFSRLNNRVRKVEDAIERLSSHVILNPNPTTLQAARPASQISKALSPDFKQDHQDLVHALLAALPGSADLQTLSKASNRRPALLNTHITRSYSTIQKQGFKTGDGTIDSTPPVQAHPVLVARFMLQLAIFLQDMHPDTHSELKALSENPEQISQRSAHTAIKFVSTQDDLIKSMEALECIVLESLYFCNSGDLKRAWISNRRAIAHAQLMGIDSTMTARHQALPKVLDSQEPSAEPEHLWFRIVSFDLLLSRMLGLSPGLNSRDLLHSMDLASDTILGRIERVHFRIMAQIEANEQRTTGDIVDRLDEELHVAARSCDSDWWIQPDFASYDGMDAVKLSWDMRRLIVQMMHFDLLSQIHLSRLKHDSDVQDRVDSSRLTCAYAAREVLARYLTIRSSQQVKSSCCLADFLGLMAAVTLSVAHLTGLTSDQQRPAAQSRVLLHQAPRDFAMVQQTLEAFPTMSSMVEDVVVSASLTLLEQLLVIYRARTGDQVASSPVDLEHHASHLYVRIVPSDAPVEDETKAFFIPYFGSIQIGPKSTRGTTNLRMANSTSTRSVPEHNTSTLSNRMMDPLGPLLPGLASNVGGSWDLHGFDETFLDSLIDNGPTA